MEPLPVFGGPKRRSGTGAERSRRFRERKRLGVVCVVQVPVYVRDVEALVEAGRLDLAGEENRTKIATAVEDLVDDFTEGKLSTSQCDPATE